ncbi:MAG TPA: PP2C family protein-serine/threonine phosphatase [Anaerolineales bacterium]|nr:PP2C family protein-serine/threonine phosphatase [Anaerolineales bacterium]
MKLNPSLKIINWLRGIGKNADFSEQPDPTFLRADGLPNIVISKNDPLVEYLEKTPVIADVDRLTIDSPTLGTLRNSGVKLITPLVSSGELLGILILSSKRSEQEYSNDDRQLINMLAAQVAPTVRVAQLVQQRQAVLLEKERLDQEMRLARLIQQTLLPKTPPELAGWQVALHYQPARAVGGDFYDFFPLPDGKIVIVIGDVTDKGVPAALVMASTRAILRGSARRMLSPGEALKRSNELLLPEIPSRMFVTCLYAILDVNTGVITYANAGHNLPVGCHAGQIRELRATGMPLGLLENMEYDEFTATIQPGESLLFYSDGLVEAHNPGGEMFGFGRLHSKMASFDHVGETLVDYLLADLESFTGEGWEQEDDVTLLTLHFQAPGGEQ